MCERVSVCVRERNNSLDQCSTSQRESAGQRPVDLPVCVGGWVKVCVFGWVGVQLEYIVRKKSWGIST